MADNFLTLGEQFNTSGISDMAPSYQPVVDVPQAPQSLFPDWVNDIQTPAQSPDISPEINSIIQDIRYNSMDLLQKKGKSGVDSVIAEMFPNSNKIDLSYSVPITQTHEMLSDGKTWIPKYETYLPGANNDALNASTQSNWEKFFNPIKKGSIKVGRGVFADIGSFVYGIGEAAITGRAESVFDNGMSRYIDDLDKKTDFNYKNYYTEAQNGLGANLYTWDKLLGGAEFTARMLGAEAIIAAATGGASLPASFARQGARLGLTAGIDAFKAVRTAEALSDVAEIGRNASKVTRILNEPVLNVARQGGGVFSAERYAQGLQSAINSGKTADYLKQARFAITGSMYESGFETRHYQTEAENAFWDYYRQKGADPSQEEINTFYGKLDDTAWNVFTANMGILSVSNLALFGNMMNIKNPFGKLADGSYINKNLFRIGTERTAEGVWAPLKAGFFNKAAAFANPVAKGILTEGVFEEGGQGIASNMMKNYISSTYDPKAMKETADYTSSFSKAFKDQFSTKEGIEEVVIGGIIGGLFGGVNGGRQVSNEYKQQAYVAQVQNALPQVADSIVSNLYTNESLASILGHSNRLQQINERQNKSQENSDITGNTLHSVETFVSALQAASTVGKTDEFLNVLKDSLIGMDNATLAEGQNISEDQVEAFKADKIAGVESIAENYAKAREAGQYLFGRGKIGGFTEIEGQKINTSTLIDSFAYVSTMGRVSEQLASDAYNSFQNKLSELGTNSTIKEEFGVLAALQSAGEVEVAKYTQAAKEETRLINQREKLETQLLKAQQQENTTEIVNKLEQISQNLLDLNAQIVEANSNKELYWTAISDNFYQKLGQNTYLPQIDLTNFEGRVGNLQNYLSNNNAISQYDKLELGTLLNEFDKANTVFKSFNSLANTLASPDFKYKTYNNIFSGLRAKNDQSLNDLTKQALIDLYNTDTKVGATIEAFQPTPSLVTKEVIDSINNDETYTVPQEVLDFVTNKVKNNNDLSEYERQVYQEYKDVVDTSIADIQSDPINADTEEADINSYKAQITSKKNEIKQLNKGTITSTIQSEIDRVNKDIEDLKQQILEEQSNIQNQVIGTGEQDSRNNSIELTLEKGLFSGDLLRDYNFLTEGSESTVYQSKDGSHVIKISEPYGSNSETLFNSRINSVLLGNQILGDGSLEVIGYYEYNGVRNPIYKQNFISGEALSEEEVKQHLINNGAIEVKDQIYLRHNGTLYNVTDFSDNYFKNDKGEVIGIDVTMYESQDTIGEPQTQTVSNNQQIEEINTRRVEEINTIPLVPSINQDNDPELQKRIDEYADIVQQINTKYDEEISNLPQIVNVEELAPIVPEYNVNNVIVKEEEIEATPTEKILELQSKINELEDSKNYIINDRIEDLKSELEYLQTDLTNQESLDRKKAKLSERINKLKSEILRDRISQYKDTSFSKTEKYPFNWKNIENLSLYELEQLKEKDKAEIAKFEAFLGSFNSDRAYSPKEINSILERNNLLINKKTKKIWDSIEKGAELLEVKIKFSTNYDFDLDTDVGGYYAHDANTIVISVGNWIGNQSTFENYSKVVQHIVTHELIHGVTARATQNYDRLSSQGKEKIDELNKLLPKLKKYAKGIKGEYYGLTNIDELMAEMANPKFRKFVNFSNTEFIGGLLSLFGYNTGRQKQIRDIIEYLRDVTIDEDLSQYYSNKEYELKETTSGIDVRYGDINDSIGYILEDMAKDAKVKKLRKLEQQLKDLNDIKEDFNPDANYYDQLEWIINNSNIVNYESVEELISLPSPSQEDIDRYTFLSNKKRKTAIEQAELKELKDKLLPLAVVQGSGFDGISLVDIIDNYNQIKTFKDIQEIQIERIPDKDMKQAIAEVQNQESTPEYRAANVGLVYDGVYTQGGTGVQKLYHIKLNTIIDSALARGLPITIQEFKTEGNNIVYSNDIEVTYDNAEELGDKYDNFNGVKITIGDEIIVEKSEKGSSFTVSGDIFSMLGYYAYDITGQPTSYNLLYEEKIDGTLAPKQSEFQVTRDGNEVPFDRETLNSVKPGDKVTLFFDINDDYNKGLTPEEYTSKGNIYVLKNGNLINILKAKPNYEVENGGWAELTDLRQQVVEASTQNKTVSIEVSNTYMGLPIITLNEGRRAVYKDIVEDKVVSYGYIDELGNYNFFTNGTKIDNSQYTDPYKELGKVVPIVAFEYNSKIYTFPIQVKPEGVNAQDELDVILENPNLSEYNKMFQVNLLLGKYNLDNIDFVWTNTNDTRNMIRNAFASIEPTLDLKNETEFLSTVKSIVLDMNNPFMSSKLVFNMKNIQETLNDKKEKKNTKSKTKPSTTKGKDNADENQCK